MDSNEALCDRSQRIFLYLIAIMYTNVDQKVIQGFRKYKNPDKRSENPILILLPNFPKYAPDSLMKIVKI